MPPIALILNVTFYLFFRTIIIIMNSSTVWLDVGGRYFKTSKLTLCQDPDSHFSRMFANEWKEQDCKNQEDAIFIDRDPESFALILDFLRYGECALPEPKTLHKLEKDIEYFNLQQMSVYVKKLIPQQVCLDVGGHLFKTMKDLLCSDPLSYFSQMFASDWKDQDFSKSDHAIFLDQDPNCFALILDFLKYGKCKIPDEDIEFKKLLKDVDFFNLKEMFKYLRDESNKVVVLFNLDTLGGETSEGMVSYNNIAKYWNKLVATPRCQVVERIMALYEKGHGTSRDPVRYLLSNAEFRYLLEYLRSSSFLGCDCSREISKDYSLGFSSEREFCPTFRRFVKYIVES